MNNLSYTNTNTVNAQLIQGLVNGIRNQQIQHSMLNNGGLGGGNPLGPPELAQLGQLAQQPNSYSPEVINIIKRVIQSASGGNLSYGGKNFLENF